MKNLEKRGEKYFFRTVIDGRKIREYVGTNSRDARRRAKLLQERYRVRAKQPGGILTVLEFSERWKLEYVAQERNAKGQDLASRRLNKYTLPELGRMFLEDVRPEHLRGLFRYAVEVGALAASPFRGRLMPRIEEQKPRGFTEDQVRKVIEVSGRYEFPIRLALLTGLRWGEIHRLTWHDIRELPDPHIELERTKSGRVRRVPLSTEVRALIAAERSGCISIFVYRWRHRESKQIVRYIRGRKGIDFPFTFHGLRHTFARRWVESGASLATLQEILGHSTVAVTQRYAKMTDEAVFAEARRVLG